MTGVKRSTCAWLGTPVAMVTPAHATIASAARNNGDADARMSPPVRWEFADYATGRGDRGTECGVRWATSGPDGRGGPWPLPATSGTFTPWVGVKAGCKAVLVPEVITRPQEVFRIARPRRLSASQRVRRAGQVLGRAGESVALRGVRAASSEFC